MVKKRQVDPEHITSVLHALVERCANKGIFSLSLHDLKTTVIRTNELKEKEIADTDHSSYHIDLSEKCLL